jgi:hypothetical protein
MKTASAILLLGLFIVGCSKKETVTTPIPPIPFALAQGDLASPVEVVPDKIGARNVYRVPWKLSATKMAALNKVAQAHPGREIEIMTGSRILANVQAPADANSINQANATLVFNSVYNSADDAREFADSLRELHN